MANKKTEINDEELLSLHKAGHTARAIAAMLERRGTPLSKSSVDERLARLAAAGVPVRGKAKRAKVAVGAPADAPAEGSELEAPPDEGDDLEATRRRLERVRAMIDANEGGALRGEVAMSSWASLCRLEADLVDRALSQVPPVPVAPEGDPVNRNEAEACLARFAAAVAAAEETVLCQHCYRRPF